ncbi:MAG: glycosyltransferase family 4 protein [Isosphaeraceae bacterium]
MKLGLIADTRHYVDAQGRVCTLTHVTRQLDCWADWFPELVACVPVLDGPPPPTHTPYRRLRVRLKPLAQGGGNTWKAKLGLAAHCLRWWPRILETIEEVDAVHLRCPCNIGLVGLLALQGSTRPRHAVYTANWAPYPEQSWASRLQRRLLASPRFGGPVSIYGTWPGQAAHLVTSFPPSFTMAEWRAEDEQAEARAEALARDGSPSPVRLLAVGHLDDNKSQKTIVEAVANLRNGGLPATLDVIGEGPLRERLEALRDALGLGSAVRFHGRLSYDEVCRHYRECQFIVLSSRIESYGKVLTEGMLHGCVPLASEVGITEEILGRGARGLTFPFGDSQALADGVRSLAGDGERLASMVREGRSFTMGLTIEGYRDLIEHTLRRSWPTLVPEGEVVE